jgi:hypothetical protein
MDHRFTGCGEGTRGQEWDGVIAFVAGGGCGIETSAVPFFFPYLEKCCRCPGQDAHPAAPGYAVCSLPRQTLGWRVHVVSSVPQLLSTLGNPRLGAPLQFVS